MGQIEDWAYGGGFHHGIRIERQTVRRFIAALGLAGLTALSLAQATKPTLTFDENRAWGYLEEQVKFGPRVPGSNEHRQTRDYIVEKSLRFCDTVSIQPFKHTWRRTGRPIQMWNVIGLQNWDKAKTRVAVFAHWDTRPTADMESDPERQNQPIPGANDGASGVAILLELMQSLKSTNPDLGIAYVFLDGEDLGPGLDEMFLGATYYASNLPKLRPDYGILLDMVGDKDLKIPMEPNSLALAPELTKELFRFASAQGLRDIFPPFRGDIPLEDDHLALNKAGVPTVDLIDFEYEPWHTLRDTPENCSPKSLGKVGALLEAWFKRRPIWTSGS